MTLSHHTTLYGAVSEAADDFTRTDRESDVVYQLADLTGVHGPLVAARMLFAPEVSVWPSPFSLPSLVRLRRALRSGPPPA